MTEEKITGQSILEVVLRYAQTQPDRLCVADPEEALTYAQFAARVARKAGQLAAMGVRRGDRLMAATTQRGDYLALQMAAHRLGAIFVPVAQGTPKARAEEIRKLTGAAFFLETSRLEGEPAAVSCPMPTADMPATILFTTGTTGASKGIELSHRAEVAVAQNVFYGTQMEPDTVELIPMPISHSYGLRHVFGLLLGGRSVVLGDGVTLCEDFFGLMDRYAVNAVSLTPATINILKTLTGDRLGRYPLRYLQLGTAGVDGVMKDELRALLPHTRLYQYYSSTEAGCACIFNFREDRSLRRVGRPAVNSTFTILDENWNEIHADENHWGYIACAGPMNMTGYYREPELTRQTMRGGVVRSQDIGYIDEEGYLCFVGRASDVINTGGYKVAPQEVEEAAMRFGGLRECVVCGKTDALLGQSVYLGVVPEKDGFDVSALAAYLRRELEPWKAPARIEIIPAVPRNALGKVQRSWVK